MSDDLPDEGDVVVQGLRELANSIEDGDVELRGASVEPITKTIRYAHEIKEEERIVGKTLSVSVGFQDD